jgi:hypothetical protein
MLMADPNANESKTKTKTGRDSSRLKTRESALQNLYHRGVGVFWSRDRHTNAVCERMSLLRILTCFARVLRPDVTSRPTAGRWIQQLFVGNRSCVGIAWPTRGPKNLPNYPCIAGGQWCWATNIRRMDLSVIGGVLILQRYWQN